MVFCCFSFVASRMVDYKKKGIVEKVEGDDGSLLLLLSGYASVRLNVY
jgi:hypothetical protein